MKYLWTEDTGAGLHFWQLINQLFFDNELAIESKESNQGILDALSDLEIKADDKYYIAFDYVVDNQDIRNKYRMLKSISEKSGGKVTILDMICFEYLILAFGKLVTWTGTGKADKIKIREDVLSAIEDHRINLSKIDDEKTLQYLASFKRYSTERVMKSLVGEFTQNEKWSVKGPLMGECWYKDCCVSEHPDSLRCGKPEVKGGSEKIRMLMQSETVRKVLQEKALLSYIDRKKNKIDEIKKYLDEVVIAYDDVTDSEIKSLLEEDLNEFKLDINRLNQFCNEMLSKNDKLFEKVDNTEWKKKRIAIQNKYVSVMQNLQDNGLDTVKLDTLMEQRNNKKEEIDRILIKEKQLCKLEEEYESLESVYRNKVDIIYKLRNNFIQEVIGNDKNVKFQLAKNRNRNSFINNLKAIMQKEITSVDDDINELADLYFKKEDGIEKYKKMLISIRNKEDQKSLSKKTRDIITSIAEDSFARMIAFIPDDDLIVSYRPEKAKKFIPLSNASAGQKTTTILTFLLAYGNQPLLLDQPEDDLDNRLVYDLIVARLKVAKSKRQIIVVTHNANIPVNGDSEYIISMDSETDIIQVNQTGTMDDESIRQEICDVMEGTKDAFEMRAKKYHFNIKE